MKCCIIVVKIFGFKEMRYLENLYYGNAKESYTQFEIK